MNEETFHCNVGLDESKIIAYRNIFINKNRDVRRYIDSFLRKTIYNMETIGSIEFALNRFVDYLENIELEGEMETTKEEVKVEDSIDDRFEILDL